jgi:hypothetical protein
MYMRQKDTTGNPIAFLMVSDSTQLGVEGLSPTVTISKNNAAFASPAGAVSEIGDGWYSLAGNATDRNTQGEFLLHATEAGVDPVDIKTMIVAFNPFDTVRLGLTALPNVAPGTENGLPILDAGGAVTANANIVAILGDAGAATVLYQLQGLAVTSGTATGVPTVDSCPSDATVVDEDFLLGSVIVFITGDLKGQHQRIDTIGTDGTIVPTDSWTRAPEEGDDFLILGR